jgi:N-methylhydantoinase B
MGARRGGRGALAQVQKRGPDGSPSYGVALEPGEFVVSHSAGGAGYGPPFERDPGRVLHDLREGWMAAALARSVYGVVTTGDGADDTLPSMRRRPNLCGLRCVQPLQGLI